MSLKGWSVGTLAEMLRGFELSPCHLTFCPPVGAAGVESEKFMLLLMRRSPYPIPGPPFTQTAAGPNGATRTTLDGFGRTTRVETGYLNGSCALQVSSRVDMVYAPCACSPLGKLKQVSQPYAPNTTPVWTTYTYDGLGRTLTVQLPDGSATTTSYAGNQTKTTDAATKWKTFTTDALGNLTSVVEPDPANQPNGTVTTSYTYDWMKHVSCVDMVRGGTLTSPYTYTSNGVSCTSVYTGGTRQTRTFVYDTAGRLTAATNPENGTVGYTYNLNSTLNYKHDAKGQDTVYTYDSLVRVSQIQRYPYGKNSTEDLCGRVTYTYGDNTTNPYLYAYGRLLSTQYRVATANVTTQDCAYGTYLGVDAYTESYIYHPAGAVTTKQLSINRPFIVSGVPYGTASLSVGYAYDTAGRTSTISYPGVTPAGSPTTLQMGYTYDTMGRPSILADQSYTIGNWNWVQGVSYDYAGRMNGASYYTATSSNYVTQSMTYNANGQLATLGWNTAGTISYNYTTGQNNGQIAQVVDAISGETINYQYDALKRLTWASTATSGCPATPGSGWTQSFTYDGFGNLTQKTLNGNATSIAVNAATNQVTNAYYDTNGNMTSGVGGSFGYDEANRMVSATETGGGKELYGFAPDNKRVYRASYANTGGWTEEVTLYGARGEKLGVCQIGVVSGSSQLSLTPIGTSVWFAGKLIWEMKNGSGGSVLQDRLGTNRAGGAHLLPYGDETTATANDQTKFATYNRDSYTTLDYADQRFYASTYGRFNTADMAGAAASNPGSWNRYSYTQGDPVNGYDPHGLFLQSPDGGDDSSWPCGAVNSYDGVTLPDPSCYGLYGPD